MTKKELIYEGKAKTLFFYDNNKIIQYFKDDATAFNKKKHEIIMNCCSFGDRAYFKGNFYSNKKLKLSPACP